MFSFIIVIKYRSALVFLFAMQAFNFLIWSQAYYAAAASIYLPQPTKELQSVAVLQNYSNNLGIDLYINTGKLLCRHHNMYSWDTSSYTCIPVYTGSIHTPNWATLIKHELLLWPPNWTSLVVVHPELCQLLPCGKHSTS